MELRLRGAGNSKSFPFYIDNNPRRAELHSGTDIYIFNYRLLNEEHVCSEQKRKEFLKKRNVAGQNRNNEVRELKGTYLFCGFPYLCNYGHITLNAAGAFLLAKKLGLAQPALRIIMPSRVPFHDEIKAIYGMQAHECIDLADNVFYKVERLFYCDAYHGNYFHPDYVALFEEVAESIPVAPPANIYITRKANGWRVPRNETEVTAYFEKKHFKIIDFGTIPVRDQIALVKNANIICAGHGASGANLVYRGEQPFTFIEYFTERFISGYNTNILFSKNADYCGYVLDVQKSHPATLNLDTYDFNFDLHERECAEPVFRFRRGMLAPAALSGMAIYERYITPYIRE